MAKTAAAVTNESKENKKVLRKTNLPMLGLKKRTQKHNPPIKPDKQPKPIR